MVKLRELDTINVDMIYNIHFNLDNHIASCLWFKNVN